ncbi:MAG: hypothetical protein V4677_06565 [Bacteroidota bacterium]
MPESLTRGLRFKVRRSVFTFFVCHFISDTFAKSIQKHLPFFFLLEQKETKIQGERPTSIYPAVAPQNGGSLSFAKSNRTITNVCSDVALFNYQLRVETTPQKNVGNWQQGNRPIL